MKVISIKKEECCGCGACENVCPKKCIIMKQDDEGFFYPEVDESVCVQCNMCVNTCPFRNVAETAQPKECYAAIYEDEKIRMMSSSGAIFSLFGQYVISQRGDVFGSAFSDDFKRVEIIGVDNYKDLERLYGSKYVQSQVSFSYQHVKESLIDNKIVLFSGTPCQVSGLRRYLKRDYENLYCIDIICHGVPSPMLWEKYASSIEEKYGGKISFINFRCKDKSWSQFGMKARVGDMVVFEPKENNSYLYMFLRNYCLRPTCYQCKMKGHSEADITIGDFWGINNIYPDMNDDRGISSIMVRNEKGKRLVELVKPHMTFRECTYEDIVRNNSAELYSVQWPKERNTFFLDINNLEFSRFESKYMNEGIKKKVIRLVKKMIRKL